MISKREIAFLRNEAINDVMITYSFKTIIFKSIERFCVKTLIYSRRFAEKY